MESKTTRGGSSIYIQNQESDHPMDDHTPRRHALNLSTSSECITTPYLMQPKTYRNMHLLN